MIYERWILQFVNPDFTASISDMVDSVIQQCPIDVRRGLYENIVLSGGSTMFKDLGRRIQRDLKRISSARLALSEELSGGRIKVVLYFGLCGHGMSTMASKLFKPLLTKRKIFRKKGVTCRLLFFRAVVI